MNIHFSYHFKQRKDVYGFGDFVLTNVDHPPRTLVELEELKERISKLENIGTVVIIAWNVMEL